MKTAIYTDRRGKTAKKKVAVYLADFTVYFSCKAGSVEAFKRSIDSALATLDLKGFSASEVRQAVNARLEGRTFRRAKTFRDLFEAFGESRPAHNTRAIYRSTLARLESFDKDLGKRSIESIDEEYVLSFRNWALETAKLNSVNVYLRCFRAVMKSALKRKLTKKDVFSNIKIKNTPTRKRALTLTQLRKIRDFTDYDPRSKKYYDAFMLSFYLRGMNIIDLLALPKNAIVDGRIDYDRSKTMKPYSVKVEPEAMRLISRWPGKTHLLSFGESCTEKNFCERMNDWLKTLVPGATSYWARHTVATMAYKLGYSLDVVAQMLGHTNNARIVTMVYIDFDNAQADEAMRSVIDMMNADKKNFVFPR